MRRYLVLAILLSTFSAGGLLWLPGRPGAGAEKADAPWAAPVASAAAPSVVAPDVAEAEPELVAPASPVTDADREARRFKRYDKDKDARVSRDEYLALRQKAFARLDKDGDGRLGFEEFAAATAKKFGKADLNGDGALAAKEFATTAVKRRAKPVCECEKEEQEYGVPSLIPPGSQPFCEAIQSSTRRSRIGKGCEPDAISRSWKLFRSNLGPSAFSAFSRCSMIFSIPIL